MARHACDRCPGLPPQRNLLVDIAEIRQATNEEHTRIRWAATENVLVDCMAKQLDSEVFMNILRRGQCSIVRDEEFLNPKTKKASKQQPQQQQLARRPGVVVDPPGGQEGRLLEAGVPDRARNARTETKENITDVNASCNPIGFR